MKQKRTLLFEDSKAIEKYEVRINQFLPIFTKIKTCYEGLEIGEFTDEVYKDLLNNGVNNIRSKYSKAFDDKIGGLPLVIRQSIERERDVPMDALKMAFDNLKSHNTSGLGSIVFPLDCITIFEGVPTINKLDKEKILERYHRVYIEGDIEHDVYAKLKALEKGFNDCLEVFDKANFTQYFTLQNLENLFYQKDNRIVVRTDAVHYITNLDKDIVRSKSFVFN